MKKIAVRRKFSGGANGDFPEFQLISLGIGSGGSVTYVAQSKEEILKFEKVVGTCRIEQMCGDIHRRGETLSQLKREISMQFQKYRSM